MATEWNGTPEFVLLRGGAAAARINLQFNEPVWSQSIMQRATAGYADNAD
jgi:hypothetical protein